MVIAAVVEEFEIKIQAGVPPSMKIPKNTLLTEAWPWHLPNFLL